MMGEPVFTIRGAHVVDGDGVAVRDVVVEGGQIAEIGVEVTARGETVDGHGMHLIAGVLDCHVHFNDPGRAHWEGWATGSAAAASGGTTTVLEMPFNALPPTVDRESFHAKVDAADGRSLVDFGLFGGMHGGNLTRLEELSDLGVAGFKAFMCDTGLDEFPGISPDELFKGMQICAGLGRTVLVHAETHAHPPAADAPPGSGLEQIRRYLAARPAETEVDAVRSAIDMAEASAARLHIVHVSAEESLHAIRAGRAKGVDVSAETCPHYLSLESGDVEQLGAVAKCSPPIRDHENQQALWAGISEGVLTMVGSDHSPAGPAEKLERPFEEAWGGIAGCQSLLANMLTRGVHERGVALPTVSELLGRAPAHRFGIPSKGVLEIGADADLALVDLDRTFTLKTADLRYRHAMSPYVGISFRGAVVRTWLRGRPLVVDGTVDKAAANGRFLPATPFGVPQ
ncbi:allantoinase AllB [Streptomyces sp. NPDC058045]|uniref:allantoinase AllB n=1 Tax=Streptomyces sp. NPDC058045 TaxID=3346311 RepID=UPI0036E9ECA5